MSFEDGAKLNDCEAEPIVESLRTDGFQHREDAMRRTDSVLDEELGRLVQALERLGDA